MMTVYIPLKDIVIDHAKKIDISLLPPEKAISLIKNSYGFLSSTIDVSIEGELAVIQFKEEKAEKVEEALALYKKGVKEAESGNYPKAIKNFRRVIEIIPHHVDARRNLGMAHLELGDVEKAKAYLRECLQLEPNNSWTNLLLGNIYSKHEHNLEMAEFFYQKCYEINPNDNFLLNNYAALMMEMGNLQQAKELFKKALDVDSTYPNTYYGLALLHQTLKEPELALQVLEKLFLLPRSKDIRSKPVYKHARNLYKELNKEVAEKSFGRFMELIIDRKKNVESRTGFPIQIVEDNSLEYVSATAQMAWKHQREEHVIKFRKKISAVTPHLIAHELEHIALEDESRNMRRNRHFATTTISREHAIKSVGSHVQKLQDWGYPDDKITQLMLKITSGLCNQLFNCPSDMMVEYRIHENVQELFPSQFISVCLLQEEALTILANKEIKKLTPPLIYRANIALNCASALFVDHLFSGKTEYSFPYKDTEVFPIGTRLFNLWLEKIKTVQPGDEYDLVDEYARLLRLENWYEWKYDSPEETTSSVTNPELLKSKESSTFWYCLDALRRFESMSNVEIYRIASEIGILGTRGIDYADPTKKYSLKSIPDKEFTGLQLLCLMYVGFQKIEPTMDTGLDFKDAYTLALDAYKAKSN